MEKLELLAPAGNGEALIAAINNGANAVYLGMHGFNARNKAENFNENNIREFVKLAHLYGVKVYLTVNTLIKNSEVGDLISLVKTAVNAKVDAYIIQDFGVAMLLKQNFPGIVMHASTQMGIHNLEGALVAKSLGFTRVVLSREATIQDIKQIKQNCNIEIEYFVQGALCVAFSGNCYFSSLCFNESGNRGRCLQPCRLCYSASCNGEQINSGYLLSPNDLCLIGRLKELIKAGVTSFKIEGRMRRSAYVAQSVSSYRKAIDNVNIDVNKEIKNLTQVFSRGEFNKGYYLDNNINKNIINPNFQNHRGIKIGTVLNVEKFKDLNKITIKCSNYKLHPGDGLKFILDGNETSMGVGNVIENGNNVYVVFSKNNPLKNSEVYLALNSEWEQKLLEVNKKLSISAKFEAKVNSYAVLLLTYKNVTVSVKSAQIIEQAKNAPATFNQVYDSVNRFNETHFELNKFDCNLENVFIPKSVVNEMRREAVIKLEQEIINAYELTMPKVEYKKSEINLNNVNFCNNTYYIVDEHKTYDVPKNSCVVLAPTEFNKQNISKLKEVYKTNKIFVMLPLIKKQADNSVINEVLELLNKQTEGIVINNIYGLHYILKGFKVVANYPLNITNNYAAKVLYDLGVSDLTKSIESNLTVGLNYGINYCGYPTLMTYCHCPYKTSFNYSDCKNCKFNNALEYTNERGHTFKIRRTKVANCYFELVNDIKLNSDGGMIDLRGN